MKKNEEIFDSTIRDLHKTREKLVAKFKGDLMALIADARARQDASGRVIIRGASSVSESK